MNKQQLIGYFGLLGSLFGDIDIKTTSINAGEGFRVWECTFECPKG